MLNTFKSRGKHLLIVALLSLAFINVYAQNSLPHSTPEKQGVSAAAIDSFLTAVAKSKNEFHSMVIVRHGNVIAEGWWNPYRPDLKHTMYSLSKSFTSTAIGFAVTEGKLSINDKVVSFFPNSLPDTVKPWLAQLKVRDLLTMSVGMEPDPTSVIPFKTTDWVKAFLATPILHEPGTKFLYNSMATFMLSAIVQKVTGQTVYDYLKPRLFDPLGFTGEDWEQNLQGINTGGWGLRLKTEDMAKMGQLYLQKGMWNGKQILPAAWVNEATTFKIDQAPDAPKAQKDTNDWMQGYCYQFWRCRHNEFRGDGAFGQYIIVMPDQDAVIAITSESSTMPDELNLVWKYLLPAMKPNALPVDEQADAELDMKLAALSLAPLANSPSETIKLNGKSFSLKPNGLHIKSIAFHLNDDKTYTLSLAQDSATYKFNFANGSWLPGQTTMQGPNLLNGAHENIAFLSPSKIVGSYMFVNFNTVKFKIKYIESPHSETFTCYFEGDKLTVTVDKSSSANKVILASE